MSERVIFIPGLAAESRLFDLLKDKIHGVCLDFPEHNENDSLSSFARKYIQKWNITKDDTLIGFSFGGMLAKEIREIVPSERRASLIILSGFRNSDSLDRKFIKRSKYVKYIPNFLLRFLAIQIGPTFTARTPKEQAYKKTLKNMAKTTSIPFLKWATEASRKWTNKTEIAMIQIHGEKDSVIPYSQNEPNYIIKDAAHLICYTHADEISEIIKDHQNE